MTNETIFYTQIGSVVTFLLAVFGVYRLLVEQKDAVIQLLKERISDQAESIRQLELKTPDALAKSLSDRVERQLAEIERLRVDETLNNEEILRKEAEMRDVQLRLTALAELIKDSDFLCPKCGSPLVQRGFYTIHGYSGGRDVEAEIEHVEYQCGLSINHEGEVSPCKNTPP